MNPTTIRQKAAAYAALDPHKLDAKQFAESMAGLQSLHEEVAQFLAEDSKQSWQATQLHNTISEIEANFAKAATQPRVEAARLSENQNKLTRVLKQVTESALAYRKNLGEATAKVAKTGKLVEEVTKRGRQWKALAERRKVALESLQRKYKLATEALDVFTARYNRDVTALGSRVVELEFPEVSAKPEIAEALSKAKLPKDIAAIREGIEGKDKSKEKISESKTNDKKTGKVDESKVEDKEDKTEVQVLSPRARIGSVNESIALAKRLSVAAAAA